MVCRKLTKIISVIGFLGLASFLSLATQVKAQDEAVPSEAASFEACFQSALMEMRSGPFFHTIAQLRSPISTGSKECQT
jgi:hypothetical protein